LLAPPGDLSHGVLRSLAAAGASVLLVCEPTSSIRLSSHVARVLLTRKGVFASPDLVEAAINAEHERAPIDVVLASSMEGLSLLAALRDKIAPPVYPMAGAELLASLNDKAQFERLCSECGVPTPRTILYADPDKLDYTDLVAKLGERFVLKPLSASGGDGVSVVKGAAEFRDAHHSTLHMLDEGLELHEYSEGEY
jgi:glutathione synthase/RimK-type ligase-like ATP-grasp enzyme